MTIFLPWERMNPLIAAYSCSLCGEKIENDVAKLRDHFASHDYPLIEGAEVPVMPWYRKSARSPRCGYEVHFMSHTIDGVPGFACPNCGW